MKTLFENFMEHLKQKTSQGAAGSIGLFGAGSLPEVVDLTSKIQTNFLFMTQANCIFILQAGALAASIFVGVLTSIAWFEKRRDSRQFRKEMVRDITKDIHYG